MPKTSPEKLEYIRRWKAANRDRVRASAKRSYVKPAFQARQRAWVASNRERIRTLYKAWYRKPGNREKVSAAVLKRRRANHGARIGLNLRRRVNALIGGGGRASTSGLLGCTISELRAHLEAQFKPGMTWGNYGRYGWHIDHIRPCASFDLTDPEQQRACFHYTNLQPLWAQENLSKQDRLDWQPAA